MVTSSVKELSTTSVPTYELVNFDVACNKNVLLYDIIHEDYVPSHSVINDPFKDF